MRTPTPREIWIAAAVVWTAIAAILLFRNRRTVGSWIRGSTRRFKSTARSVSGRVADAASDIVHTERPDHPSEQVS